MRFLWAWWALALTAVAGGVPVGTARVDITPDFPVLLSGYGSRQTEAQSAAGKLWVKALAMGNDSDGPALIITVDGLGIPIALTSKIAERLKARAGIAREKIAIGASHTHSAPVINGCAPNIIGRPFTADEQAHIDRYTELLTAAIETAAWNALQARVPMRLAWGQGQADFAINRRVLKNNAWTGFGEVPEGPVDHALPVLRAVDESGRLRAIVLNYACHCTTLNPATNQVHGDWAGLAQEMLERDNPGSAAMTLIGCVADSNPRGRDVGQKGGKSAMDVAQSHARSLANEVNRLLKTDLTPLSGPPSASLQSVRLPFERLPSAAELTQQRDTKKGHDRMNALIQLDKIKGSGSLPDAIDYSVQIWKWGDALTMIFLPGEVVVDYAIGIKKEFDPKRIWVSAYINASPCYIPSERILKEGGYEAEGAMLYYGWPSKLKTGVESLIREAVRAQVEPTYRLPASVNDQSPRPDRPCE